MAINIKNDETEQLVRRLADVTGESMTMAVTVAVRQRLDRERSERDRRVAELVRLGREIAAELGPNPMRPEDLYDPVTGLPA